MNAAATAEHGTHARTGRVVVICGPSGSGKTTVCQRLLADPEITRSVSATTRPARPDEKDGIHYHFIARPEFVDRLRRGCFAEHAEYSGHLYGTPREPLEAALAHGRTILLEIDVQGAEQLRRVYPDGLYIFLDAPDRAEVQARLEKRNTETPDERRRRLDTAERERAAVDRVRFDYRVINDDLDRTVARIRELIRGSRAAPASPKP